MAPMPQRVALPITAVLAGPDGQMRITLKRPGTVAGILPALVKDIGAPPARPARPRSPGTAAPCRRATAGQVTATAPPRRRSQGKLAHMIPPAPANRKSVIDRRWHR
jgi:hypothetical protein